MTRILDVTRRPSPRPNQSTPRPPLARPKTQPHPPAHAQAAPPHRELARVRASARVTQPRTARVHARADAQVAQQPVDFEATIERLRRENDPVVTSERPVQHSQITRAYAFGFSGSAGAAPHGEGILTPEKSWQSNGYDYYYVRYWVQYPDGSTETGIVPWPLQYSPADDPFRLHMLHFPLPGPLADFVLPAGTALHPLVAYCYEHRDELPSCPIEHD